MTTFLAVVVSLVVLLAWSAWLSPQARTVNRILASLKRHEEKKLNHGAGMTDIQKATLPPFIGANAMLGEMVTLRATVKNVSKEGWAHCRSDVMQEQLRFNASVQLPIETAIGLRMGQSISFTGQLSHAEMVNGWLHGELCIGVSNARLR